MKMTFKPVTSSKAKPKPKKLYLMLFMCKESIEALTDDRYVQSQTCCWTNDVPSQELIDENTEPDETYLGYVEVVR